MILFEGVDKTGKTTLARELNRRTQYRHLVIDRAFLSLIAYAQIYDRPLYMDELVAETPEDLLIVYCTASVRTIRDRLARENEPDIQVEKHLLAFENAVSVWDNVMTSLGGNYRIIEVNTSLMTVEAAVDYILQEVQLWHAQAISLRG